ncbi:C4-dicarboxylic acid, orotate and citrate transporter [Legionella quinlivanii]|uniref:C4-dicarboxylic acid, orotate and citrate transporter n=1 Tax=Legionella quinlivanii TaxID=45073 RepID=A0A0W0Y3C5_9GAMM|nr:C4-dicarboxylate transporter DctA [Legionella quinlivanii]KTD51559.1 C4-dicarboxylic acid, orotate and citrate transporter [Legionella quinlivanii]MCW8450897.1 C4-dicarboxylate transporter DctA [Legionella quinlivanii]SEF59000.1 aerobic C4-dicarboxylate transport protein [Legionella quinlivanii DSM 21216]STY10914.1 C4-dicarboxylic acid, orotate and citrate transporter [Legionella quinlivanii]
MSKPVYHQLYFKVLLGILLGTLLGHFFPPIAIKMQILGDGFIKLIRMMIAPIIFLTIVMGITQANDIKQIGRIGIKAIIYFELVTTLALIIAIFTAKWVQPGSGMNISADTIDKQTIASYVSQAEQFDSSHFFLNIIPDTLISAFVKGDILPVLLVSLLTAFAILRCREAQHVLNIFDELSAVLFSMVNLIMKLAPVGAFGAMAFTVGAYGIETLVSLGKLLLTVYLTCFLFIFIILGSIARLNGISIWRFLVFVKEEILIVLATSSSEAVLPRMISKLETLGCDKSVVGLVLPTGYSFNLDGTTIYLGIATVFIAQAFNIDLSLKDELLLMLILMLTSKGAAAVTGGGFIVLAATLSSLHTLPVEGLVLILGIDRFMSEARSITNLIGNGIATITIANLENDFNREHASRLLSAENMNN